MTYNPPNPNCYRLTPGIRIVTQGKGGLALCAYPLRIIRLSPTATRLLQTFPPPTHLHNE